MSSKLNEELGKIYESILLNEKAKKAKKDYDGDGKVETSEAEYKGVKDNAIKHATGKCPKCKCDPKKPEKDCTCKHKN